MDGDGRREYEIMGDKKEEQEEEEEELNDQTRKVKQE